MMKSKLNKQRGAVSLFIVIFATLLFTIVTVGFVQLMLKNQQQASESDLSQSAYDSAQAGVEDAKRLLILDQQCRSGAAAPAVNCAAVTSALTPSSGKAETECNTLSAAGLVNETAGETIIRKDVGDNKLDQAYTCVKVIVNTDDYKGEVAVNSSDIIPIDGVGSFDSIEISWFTKEDVPPAIPPATDDPTVEFPSIGADVRLPPVGGVWKANVPALLRAQFMQLGSGATLGDFDDNSGSRSNANTLFLYPAETGLTQKDFALDARRSNLSKPQQIQCNTSFLAAEYACKVTIKLPSPIKGSSSNRNALLRLTGLYNGAHYTVRLKDGSDYVKFDRVQPQVDATGRANDLFRRVKARIELKGDFTDPANAVNVVGDLCKNFTVTDSASGYKGSTTCTP